MKTKTQSEEELLEALIVSQMTIKGIMIAMSRGKVVHKDPKVTALRIDYYKIAYGHNRVLLNKYVDKKDVEKEDDWSFLTDK